MSAPRRRQFTLHLFTYSANFRFHANTALRFADVSISWPQVIALMMIYPRCISSHCSVSALCFLNMPPSAALARRTTPRDIHASFAGVFAEGHAYREPRQPSSGDDAGAYFSRSAIEFLLKIAGLCERMTLRRRRRNMLTEDITRPYILATLYF